MQRVAGLFATGGSTRWCSPALTTPMPPRTSRAGCSQASATGSSASLRDGIRAFLIDIHFGAPRRRERADPDRPRRRGLVAQQGRTELSPAALRTADRLAGRVGVGAAQRPAPSLPLPHAVRARRGAARRAARARSAASCKRESPRGGHPVRRALRAGGRDRARAEGRRPALQAALDRASTSRCRRSASSLRADTRLVILAEKDGGARPWYLPAFSFVQDTPLGATSPAPSLAAGAIAATPTARCFS